MNDKLSAKDRNTIKGAIRRAFSRSELRRAVLARAKAPYYSDPSRPRVKTWYKCELCAQHFAGYQMEVDHKDPIIPVDMALADMQWDEVVNRMWCEEYGLQCICKPCHNQKCQVENKQRRETKKKPK